jgi:subtilisin family serine protease
VRKENSTRRSKAKSKATATPIDLVAQTSSSALMAAQSVETASGEAAPGDVMGIRSLLEGIGAAVEQPTVVYIHGINNKPPARDLKREWDVALFGMDMGDRTRMAYWADIRYPRPLGVGARGTSAAGEDAAAASGPKEKLVEDTERLVPESEEARSFARSMAERLYAAAEHPETGALLSAGSMGAEAVDAQSVGVRALPNPLRGWLAGPVMKSLVPDTAAYFFDSAQRAAMQDRFRSIIAGGTGPYVVIAHSMGTVISYDVLRELENSGKQVLLYVTLGSPLGIKEVQDHITQPLRAPRNVRAWRNFAARFDIVAADAGLSNDFSGGVVDAVVWNPHTLRGDPHSVGGYLSLAPVKAAVTAVVGSTFANPLARFVVARDLAADLAGPTDRRLPALIELGDAVGGGNLDEKRTAIVEQLKTLTGGKPDARIDPMRRYVAANLTPPEVERLLALHPALKFERIWRNTEKRALINRSVSTVQARTAQLGYEALGAGISWAVLDTGIQSGHPHFQLHGNVQASWDCRPTGDPVAAAPDSDGNGHGTHVAGIIAGEGVEKPGMDPELQGVTLRGIAPKARLHAYKVLDDRGNGQESWIIKALDHIAAVNESSPNLVIHGVNLSLGGAFDPTVFQCGFSPICRELRALWRQGVLVCIAAGNEGRLTVLTDEGSQELSLDLSIGDPANLEEAIAVGSVHRVSPHLFGISYFSSRGPTADGRAKPDLVAPGEDIFSCNSRYAEPNRPNYVRLSGSSMACPHVSGILASFLSVRQEHVGYPERAKEILLRHCLDLKRDRYHQGAGLPNLVNMLAHT